MKLAIQSIKSVIKELEVTPETSVDELREQIRLMYNWPEGSKIILVHKTKILNQTTSKLSEIPTIKDGDRIVVMKKSEPPQPAQAAPLPAQPSPVQPPAPPATAQAGAPTSAAAAPPVAQSTHMFYNDSQIAQLEGMGFEAATAQRALIAAFGNTDRAVEYLLSGNIPQIADHGANEPAVSAAPSDGAAPAQAAAPQTLANNTGGLQTEAFGRVTQPAAAAAAAGAAAAATPGAAPGANPNDLDSQLGQLAAASPHYLPQILQALGEQNPALLTMIEQNPRMFSQVLASLAAGEMQEGGAAGGGAMPPAVTVQLTQAEADAVNRLCELGFSKENALQAYLACDKNEELAANFLFDNADMDD